MSYARMTGKILLLRRVLFDARAGSSNLAKNLKVHDILSFTATERKFTQNLPHRRTSKKSNFFPFHMGLKL